MNHLRVISLDWQHVRLAVSLPCPSQVEVYRQPQGELLGQTLERNRVTRLQLDNLAANTKYTLDVRWEGGSQPVVFRTLPAPRGPRRLALALLADPHISLAPENRKGRLFLESRAILSELVADINARGADGVCIAGDLTNKGNPEEFAAARDILNDLRCPLFAAPGDHDLPGGRTEAWRDHFGATAALAHHGDYAIVTLNTAGKLLGAEGAALLQQGLERPRKALILVSHLQLFEDEVIVSRKPKAIHDSGEHDAVLAALSATTTLAYIGHQNVPSRVERGGLLQLNLPQPVQFPCGYIWLEAYDNGFYHRFEPIRSALLDEGSRLECQAAAKAFDESQWLPSYRTGKDVRQSNFVWSPQESPPTRNVP